MAKFVLKDFNIDDFTMNKFSLFKDKKILPTEIPNDIEMLKSLLNT